MVNWKKWFLEEDEDEVYEQQEQKSRPTKSSKKVEKDEEDDFDIEFSTQRRSSNNKEVHEYEEDAEEINLADYEYEDDFEEEVVEKERRPKERTNGFASKIKNLFATGNEKEEDVDLEEDFEDDFEDDEAEDYKTYLERQKREREESAPAKKEKSEHKESFFSRLKDKFLVTDEDEDENIDDLFDDMYEEDEIEEIEEVKPSKKEKTPATKIAEEEEEEIDFVELRRKNREKLSKKVEEDYEELEHDFEGFVDYDNLRDEEEIEELDEIDLEEYEEKEEDVEELEKTTDLTETLKKLGVENAEIRDVDLFGDKSERRVHPTLAAVRTKRLKQDHKIENLGNEVALGRDNKELKEEVAKTLKKEEVPTPKEEAKAKERKIVDEDFNKRTRREDKIEKNNPLFAKKDEKFENALDEIEEKGTKKYVKEVPEIEVKELEAEGERREKLKYTSVEDVLRGSDDLFEDDIDRVSKKLVGERFDEEQKATEEVEEFRKDLFADKKKEQKEPETVLDELIEEEKININKKEETLPEIENLNTNLQNLQKDKGTLVVDFEEEEKEEKPKIDRLAGYSDYHLDKEEIEELEELNYLDENTDNMNIDSLIREVSPNNKVLKRSNDIDKFVDEKMVPKEVAEQRVATQAAKKQEVVEEDYYDDYEDYEENEERGIKYTEKLYTNDVGEYFDNGQGKKLGEYKIKDNGYRPVSKEKIENNQRILDEIFAKYSNTSVTAPKKSVTTTMMETNHITPRKNVGKFKPSPVYSSVYGSGARKTPSPAPTSVSTPPVPAEEKKMGISQVGLSINREEPKKEETPKQTSQTQPAKKDTIAKKEVENPSSIYKEIAAQEETVWNIGSSKRVPKTKKGNKKK